MNRNKNLITVLAWALSSAWFTGLVYGERVVPELPGPGEKIRVIIDTDAACEIDDLYAIALALISQDKLKIEGFVGAHFGDSGGPEGVQHSVERINTILDKAGMSGQFPVKHGSDPFQYSERAPESEGVDFIIEKAMASSPTDPLWVISLGPCTDIAAAYLKEPEIKDRVISFWHGRTQWPVRCWNFNAYNDLKSARILFSSPLPLVLFDTGTYLRCPMEETKEHIAPYGELGKFLHEFRYNEEWYQVPSKGFFDLGDIAAIVDPSLVEHEVVETPSVRRDFTYDHERTHGKMLRIYQISREPTFELFFDRLKKAYPTNP